jgi:hypothetical protein
MASNLVVFYLPATFFFGFNQIDLVRVQGPEAYGVHPHSLALLEEE